ncbi:aa3-type cytochrome oxidase subunit II [Nesterenkonia flava]|uniref:Cytochrome aa3 subunit 2 n=1 Tax=Nesterenkonia flava TaxID=469799 RepID=A0ABU1FPS8_9MICC|nr:cytochrome c oxidase subunit II [Nesterenkonia flava]MDR5710652.1 cytochrome c oxidase subunit II [Nesterenkonia flava]
MSSQKRTGSRGRAVKGIALAGVALLVLTACAEDHPARRGWLPGDRDTTSNTAALTDLWVNSWIAALAVGVLTWGLMLWCMIAYRRRKGETGYPRQLAYNIPLEIMYTVLPLVMVAVFFYYTDQVQRDVDEPFENPDVTLEVYGKQWAWDWNYTYTGPDGTEYEVHDTGVQAHLTGEDGVVETLPTMVLPVDSDIQFDLKSRDVIHSFWVPAFLQKRDMIPGRTSHIYLSTQEELGEDPEDNLYHGKCAELCGEYHSEMLFNVEIVSEEDFIAYLETLEEGHLGDEYNRNPSLHDSETLSTLSGGDD